MSGISLSQAVQATRGRDSRTDEEALAEAYGSSPRQGSPGGESQGGGPVVEEPGPAGSEPLHAKSEPGAHAPGPDHGASAAHNPGLEILLMVLSLAVALAGWMTARHFYVLNPGLPRRLAERLKTAYTLLLNKYYVDEIYRALVVDNFYRLMRALAWFDNAIVDGLVNLSGRLTVFWSWIIGKLDNIVIDGWGVNGLAEAFMAWGRTLRLVQTGKVQGYLTVGLLGLLAILVFRIL
jgi:NADH:ubiquinone oxidoreductase subunit 5 (subunit L)/multisubunit Na+/H+ antiporter MnhA subunit